MTEAPQPGGWTAPAPAGGSAAVRPSRAIAAAVLATTVGALPVFLLGGLAVQVRADLAFGEGQLGLAVTMFFAVSASLSALAGRWTERIGVGRVMALTAAVTGIGLLGIAFAVSYVQLLTWLAVAAVGNAFAQPGANALLARSVKARRQGLVFGAKQSAVPLTSALGGAAVPLIGLTVGWRWAFAGALVVCAAVALVAPREGAARRAARRREPMTRHVRSRAAGRALRMLMVAALLGNMGANSLGVFLVESLVQDGIGESSAGLLLVLASSSAITARIIGGLLADARGWSSLRPVSIMLATALIGYLGLAWATGPVLVPLALLTFAAGWGWNGLFALALIRVFHREPAAATGVAQGGLFLGAMAGPGLFGVAVEVLGFSWAWTAAGVTAFIAATTSLAAQRLVDAIDDDVRPEPT